MATAAIATIPSNAKPEARPDYRRPEYDAGKKGRALCAALITGTDGVRGLGEDGLPKWPAEDPEHYKLRAKSTQVARYYQRTVQASVGMICATPPALTDDADATIKADWEDLDGRGTHGEVFAKHVIEDAINGGYCGILVDAPPIPDGVTLTLADEQALGLRPFWVAIPSARIYSWIVDVPDWAALIAAWQAAEITADQAKSYAKQTIVRQVVIYDPVDVRADAFGVACIDRYRILTLTDAGVTFQVWEFRKADAGTTGEHFVRIAAGAYRAAGGKPFREIPLAIVYAGRPTAPFVCPPPLLALAELNLEHYQVSADRRYLMRLCHAPTLALIGLDTERDETGQPKKIKIGPNAVLTLPINGDAKYVAADPGALNSSKEEREELVRQMAVLGMSFIGKDKRGMAETATGRALDDAAENATHATSARGLQDGLEQALRFHAMYRGVDAPDASVNTTYANPEVDPQLAAVLWQAVVADKLDMDSFTTYLTTGALPDDIAERVDTLKLIAEEAAKVMQPVDPNADPNTDPSNPKTPAPAPKTPPAPAPNPSRKPVKIRDAKGNVTHTMSED